MKKLSESNIKNNRHGRTKVVIGLLLSVIAGGTAIPLLTPDPEVQWIATYTWPETKVVSRFAGRTPDECAETARRLFPPTPIIPNQCAKQTLPLQVIEWQLQHREILLRAQTRAECRVMRRILTGKGWCYPVLTRWGQESFGPLQETDAGLIRTKEIGPGVSKRGSV